MTTVCFMAPDGEPHFFEGLCDGQFFLGEDAVTEHGIDFEKCLTPSGYDKTLSELDKKARAALSDSCKAIRSLAHWLAT
jgi:inosine/xanthosine triphosphate pyrophosphatase family protein